MEYKMDCDDGFSVHSKNKDEVVNMGAMHVITMHPDEKLSRQEVTKMIKSM